MYVRVIIVSSFMTRLVSCVNGWVSVLRVGNIVTYLYVCRSEVSVVVLGQKGVGKTSFIEHCFVSCHFSLCVCVTSSGVFLQVDIPKSARLSTSSRHVAKVAICGREINMKIIENPGRQQLVPAIMTILLFDLTRQVQNNVTL